MRVSCKYKPGGTDKGVHLRTVSIIFVPADHPLDGQFAARCIGYTVRQGHEVYALLRDWDLVLAHLDAGRANCVVFATRDHYRHGHAPRVEFADAGQQIVRQRNAAVGRHRMTSLARLNQEIQAADSVYETARLLPRGDDGGFAERFLRGRVRSGRHMGDT